METLTLKANLRTVSGKKVRSLRVRGILPAVIYGRGVKTQNLELDIKDFEKVYRQAGENTLVSVELEGEARPVLIHEAVKDRLSDKILHADFYQVRLDEKITAKIPMVFEGESPAVKYLGGVLIKNFHELEVKALPADLPHEIKVDLTKIQTFEDNVYIKDLAAGLKAEILTDPELVAASVIPPRSESELEGLKEEVMEKVEEVKIESEEKKAAREQAKAAEEEQ